MDVRVAFDCAQQLLVVQQTSNSATRSQNIFATLKAKGGAGPPCQLADCAYTDFGVPLGASLPQVWNPEEISNPENVNTLYDWMRYAGASMVRSFLFVV